MSAESPRFALFGVDSVFAAELAESLARLGFVVDPAIVTGEPEWAMDDLAPVALAELAPEWLARPVGVPWVTPGLKWARAAAARELGFTRFPAVVDPRASHARSSELADGVYLNAGATVGAYAALAEFALVNRNASLGHHSRMGAYASLGPGVTVAARCRIGRGTLLGAGAVVAPGVSIGDNCLVAAGAVVTGDLPDRVKAAGHPARVIERDYAGYKGVSVP